MSKHPRHASRSVAVLVHCADGLERVRFYCRCCDVEQVTRSIRRWEDHGARLGTAWCLHCGDKVFLRIVGRDADIWPVGNAVIWQIDGPEVADDADGRKPAPAGTDPAAAKAGDGRGAHD